MLRVYTKKQLGLMCESWVTTLKDRGYLTSLSGQKLFIKADSVCVHGDNENALEFIKLLRKALY